jgi:predicted neuraminidase
MSNRVTIAICLAVCLVYVLVFFRRPVIVGGFSPPPFVAASDEFSGQNDRPLFSEEFLPVDPESKMAHVASMCELSGGALLAVWYAGPAELNPGVAIFGSVCAPGRAWSEPEVLVDRILASRELKRTIRKVGNPLVWSDGENRVYLLYVSAIGGWSSSSINLKTSEDGAKSWGPSVRLTLSPFCNFSELVRNRPVALDGGGFLVPIYHESIGKFPEILWLLPDSGARGGFAVWKTRIERSRGFLQPSVVALDPRSALAFLRNSCGPDLGLSASSDAGLSWDAPGHAGLPNPNSGICAIRISGQRLLMVFNDDSRPGERDNLRLAISDLGGKNWVRIAGLEDAPYQSFAYPFIIRTHDGLYHVVYTYNRTRIKHLTFNEAWIEDRIRDAGQPGPGPDNRK